MNWDVTEVWELDGAIEQGEISLIFLWHLEKPFWSSEMGKGMSFDLRPLDVSAKPSIHTYHSARIKDADIRFPLCVAKYKGREIIVDGLHRLAKILKK